MRLLAALLATTLAGGAAAEPASFARDINPILRTRCASCHMTGVEPGKMALAPRTAYANLVGAAATTEGLVRVKAGDPDASYLVMKLEGTHLEHGGEGARMPFGAPPLADAQIALFRRWIAEGAENN